MGQKDRNIRRDEEMEISKMMAEGGQVTPSYYDRKQTHRQLEMNEDMLAAKAMIDEGGLGAEIYYDKDEKIANIDVAHTEEYLN